jgi:hypothetical protein
MRGVMGIVVGLQKRKLVEKNKNKTYKQAQRRGACVHKGHSDMVHAAVRGMVMWRIQR